MNVLATRQDMACSHTQRAVQTITGEMQYDHAQKTYAHSSCCCELLLPLHAPPRRVEAERTAHLQQALPASAAAER